MKEPPSKVQPSPFNIQHNLVLFSLVAYWWNASSSQLTSMWTSSMMAPRRFCQLFTTPMNLTMTRGLGYWSLTQLFVSYSKATWQSKERFPWKQQQCQCWYHHALGEQPRMEPTLYYQVRELFYNLVYPSVLTCSVNVIFIEIQSLLFIY